MFYQWVCFVIFIQVSYIRVWNWMMIVLQAIFFFVPRFIWKTFMEAGKMKFLTAGMKELTTDEEKVAARLKMLMLGFRKVRGNNDKYAYTFCLLEVVNFVNVILQVILISTISTLYLFQYLYIL